MTLNSVSPDFLNALSAALPADSLRAAEPRYLEEPRGRYQGQAGAVALPRTVHEVSEILKQANAAQVGVVPYGGGTGLVGGQIAPEGPVPLVLSLERMNAVRAVYPEENVLVAEAGVILADVQSAAEKVDRLFPLSLAAEGTARMGGLLATNAGGVNVLRYGNTRDLCLGLEAVLPNGEIWNGLTRLRKDNTGYDLRNLLIGAEGTLGVITAAALKLSPRPRGLGTALMVVPNPAAAIDLLALARDQFGEAVSAFELMHRQGLAFMAEHLPEIRQALDPCPEWCVLIDLGLAREANTDSALLELFEIAMERELVTDGTIAQSEAQRQEIWSVREHIPIANKAVGSIVSHDISLPISAIPAFVDQGGAALAKLGDMRINCFGHLGDGNLHYNVFPAAGRSRDDYADLRGDIQTCVHDLVAQFQGSFSAEHGVGRLKVSDLEHYGDPTKLAAMRAIKSALDPNGIMNPGAVLAEQ
ncbi:FAD-binding protein [Epibacterium sp. SM1979]|uniref:FAD-binding protein n=1 Tax=Tritonibacter litoralis TaxID=2662264 RepID=A0A843YDG9_9RHOB|nr:FAD-binding oxidoreductase [Tritonibacter litoralis]MQQ09430.1 FAD-binding protein [Tritonibacter litoralis]